MIESFFPLLIYITTFLGYILYLTTKEEQKEIKKPLTIFLQLLTPLALIPIFLSPNSAMVYLTVGVIVILQISLYLNKGDSGVLYFLLFFLTAIIAKESSMYYLLALPAVILTLHKGTKAFNRRLEIKYGLSLLLLGLLFLVIQTF